jgi:two-component system cell cycle response regulator CtrA
MRLLLVENARSAWAPPNFDDCSSVVRAETPDEALSILRHDTVDMILIDLASFVEGGFAFIRQLRASRNDTPLVALAGCDSGARVRALGLGADDAIALPVDSDELRARIAAVARRHRGHKQSSVKIGDLSLSEETREVRVGNIPMPLTRKEYSTLDLLVSRRGSVVTKDMFLDHLYSGLIGPDPKIFDVLVCTLRKKLATLGAHDLIGTVRGQGYTFWRRNQGISASVVAGHTGPVCAAP